MIVIKRNGTKVPFDKNKIINAINKALIEVDGCLYESETAEEIANVLEAHVEGARLIGEPLTVEDIQDRVEDLLMQSERRDVAKAYIRYRYKKEVARQQKDIFFSAIADKLAGIGVENANANMDENSFSGRIGTASSVMTKEHALEYQMSDLAKTRHLNNEIYTHDLDHYTVGDHNCLTAPLDQLLANGFRVRQTDVRPAGSVNTAFQLTAVIFQLQSLQQFGGISAGHIDWTMVPYVRKSFAKHYKIGLQYLCDIPDYEPIDGIITLMLKNPQNYSIADEKWRSYCSKAYVYAYDMTKREIHQAAEALFHNLNTLQSRSGGQLPFTSLNFGTCASLEGRMITEALLSISIEGLGKYHKTSIFPCTIFQCMKGTNRKPGEPNYDLYQLALRSTAQRLYPNYLNCDWSNNAGYDPNDPSTFLSSMGCRTVNLADINADPGVNPQTKDGRGNCCPVTIILPTLAKQACDKVRQMWGTDKEFDELVVEEFMLILDQKIHEARDILLERYHWICSQTPDAAKFMYENNLGIGFDGKTIESVMKHFTLAIGQLGLAEALQLLIDCDHTTSEGMLLAKRIEELFSKRCKQFKEEEHLNFAVYYTPAEGLSHTALKKFREKYGIIPKVSDREYFTNSMHIPVWKEMSPFEKIDLEAQLTGYSTAGCITYVELDSGIKNNLQALETLVNYAMDKDIPYFAINVPVDECQDCGYADDMNDECLECGGQHVTHLRRVTGYLSGDYKSSFNKGKQAEVADRVRHK